MSYYDELREKQAEEHKGVIGRISGGVVIKSNIEIILERLDKIEMILEKLIAKTNI